MNNNYKILLSLRSDSQGSCPDERGNQNSFSDLFCSGLLKTGEMKEIRLTKGFTTMVDDNDYDYLNLWKWHILTDGKNYYAQSVQKIDGNLSIY